jgi:hypothetical protein
MGGYPPGWRQKVAQGLPLRGLDDLAQSAGVRHFRQGELVPKIDHPGSINPVEFIYNWIKAS